MSQAQVVRKNRFTALVVAAVLLSALLTGVGQGPVSADVTAVRGSAYGYFANVSLFGGPFNQRGPTPTVTLPAGGSAVPITATQPTGSVIYGPAGLFTSGPITVSTQGTTGPTGSVTTTSDIQTVNTSDSEVFTADRISSTCTASETGVTGSTTVLNGTVVLQDPNPDTSGEEGEEIVNVPLNPEPNTTYSGTIPAGDNFRYVFNEQIMNADGSITVNAAHQYLLGPTAVGDLIIGQVICGVTSDGTPPTTITPPTTTTTGVPPTTTTTGVPPTTTTSTIPDGDLCDGLVATIVGTEGGDTINGTRGDDVIVGLGGNDVIDGGGGNDVICGGEGNDGIGGGPGDDRLFGEAGNDQIRGQGDNDVINGGAGNDDIDGGAGDDQIDGGGGDNTMRGGNGNDQFFLRADSTGLDRIFGEAGNDFSSNNVNAGDLSLEEGDFFAGGEGDDSLTGLRGGTFSGGPGNDTLTTSSFADSSGLAYGGPGNDLANLGGGSTVTSTAVFYGGEGDDTGGVRGGTYYGEAGNDVLSAVSNGVFFGGEGADRGVSLSNGGLFCGGPGDDTNGLIFRGGTFYGEEGVDQAGIIFPGGVFVQDGDCPAEEMPGRF